MVAKQAILTGASVPTLAQEDTTAKQAVTSGDILLQQAPVSDDPGYPIPVMYQWWPERPTVIGSS